MWFWRGLKRNEQKPLPKYRRPMLAIRMEAIGGQGANSAGKILAEAAVLGMGYSGNHFSSFGSEKRGSPVRSFVRFSAARKTIRSASFISKPDILVVFHESLIWTHPEIFEGVGPETDLILNSTKAPRKVELPSEVKLRQIATIDATGLALKHECGVNAIMLGTLSTFISEIEGNILEETLQKFFSHLPAKVQQNNLEGFRAGQQKIQEAGSRAEQSSFLLEKKASPVIGYANAPLGGVIQNPGNTVLKDNSASRKGMAPQFLKEVCCNCGYCDMVCPDYCFVWKKDPSGQQAPQLLGIDYQYCKGCQKCIVACPVEALVLTLESKIPAEQKQCHLFPEVNGKK